MYNNRDGNGYQNQNPYGNQNFNQGQSGGNQQRRNFPKKPPKPEGWYVLHIKEAWQTYYGQFNKLNVKFYVVCAPDGDPQKMHKQMTLNFNSNVITGSIEDKLFKFAGGVNLMPNQQPNPQVLINKYVAVRIGIQQAKTSPTLYNYAIDIAPLAPNFQMPQGYNPNYVYQKQNNGNVQGGQRQPQQQYNNYGNQQQSYNQNAQQGNSYAKQAVQGQRQSYNQGQQQNPYGQNVPQNNPPQTTPQATQQTYQNGGQGGNPYGQAGGYVQHPNTPPQPQPQQQQQQNNPYVVDDTNDAIENDEVAF